jgi:hypothetical protein
MEIRETRACGHGDRAGIWRFLSADRRLFQEPAVRRAIVLAAGIFDFSWKTAHYRAVEEELRSWSEISYEGGCGDVQGRIGVP